jgi:HEPN domain-containing protein
MDLVRERLTKATHDLEAAKTLAAERPSLLDTAIFHCQRAAEKALKAFLTFHETPFLKTHDCRLLAQQALAHDPRAADLMAFARRLTPYAVIFRYPFGLPMPDQAEFDEAVRAADAILASVLAALPPEARPQDDL